MTADVLLKAALELVARGWSVFPVRARGKTPLTRNGLKDATNNVRTICGWWNKWPNANIGVPTENFVVADIDGAKGENSLRALEAEFGPLPRTLESSTGKGRHLWFTPNGTAIHNSASKLGEGIDIRAIGGYVVVPPSIHESGKRYEWVSGDAPLAELPAWIPARLKESTPTKPTTGGDKIPRGQHNVALTSIAGKLRHDGLEENAIATALIEICEKRCQGYGADYKQMCAKIARSVCRYPTGTESKPGPVQVDPAEIVGAEGVKLPDMPATVLCGRLGELCRTRLKDFPVAFSWPAVLAAASALVRPPEATVVRTNIYAALVGPVHCGKTAVIERSNFFLDAKPPFLEHLKAGSAEGLLAKIGNRQGQGVLLNPDELSHLLEKTQITNASFAYILNSLFYVDADQLTIARGKAVNFNARLSLVGGIVDEKFDDAFGSATTSGLYDRFLFGQCPTGFAYLWRPIEEPPAFTDLFEAPRVNRDVWEVRDHVAKAEGLNPRLLEIALRTAFICTAVDGRDELRAKDLEPAWELARYQARVRTLLQPNCGKNFEAKIALKVLGYLNRYAPKGQWVVLREVLRDTHAYEFGPSVVERAINAMRFGGAIEENLDTVGRGQKRRLIRLAGDPE